MDNRRDFKISLSLTEKTAHPSMASNFDFLKREWNGIYRKVAIAEQRILTEPVSAGFYGRLALEYAVNEIYEIEGLEIPYNSNLYNLMSDPDFRQLIPHHHYTGVFNVTRKVGNDASHKGRLSSDRALQSIKYLFGFLKWMAMEYSEVLPDLPARFDENFIPKVGAVARKINQIQSEHKKQQQSLEEQLETMRRKLEEAEQKAQENEELYIAYKQEKETQQQQVQQRKEERKHIRIPSEYTEAETRQHLIDINLQEAGWTHLKEGKDLEYPVKYMPITRDNPKGNGFVDYVLWDDDGLPLAIIEAKRTSVEAHHAQTQAKLYADAVEKMHQRRPVIFYTNGYETFIWDDTFYSAPRRIHGFYTKEELRWKIQQRSYRKDFRSAPVNKEIAGRGYQIEAIKRISETFITNHADTKDNIRGSRREALLVMATGSGKTRTSVALVEILLKHNWVKRVLFLADRNALVTQAKRSFGEHLKEVSSIDLTKEKEDENTRLVFSTYPSMVRRIDAMEEDKRLYGVGHFDLIIVDEAHRSVYNKYQGIFEYFDALVVGLTATPKKHVDTNTYELFGCSNDDPTFSYELDDAVQAGYLVPYYSQNVSTQFMREGIKYAQLSSKQKKEYEKTFSKGSTGLFPEEVGASALNKWLFNKDTIFKVLDALMQHGIHIEGGDKLGKTIIFAANQKHAEFIVSCFRERYPSYSSNFMELVHNKVSHSQSTIDKFCDKDQEIPPQIVVSVDMMDTGIDAPRVLNLVFFKMVRSYAKFWQMIGRGTRLCPDIFGPGDDKEEFAIFDICGNFDFFEQYPNGKDGNKQKSISQQIFESRLQLIQLLKENDGEEHEELTIQLMDQLHQAVQNLNKERFEVKMKQRYVDLFGKRERWNHLSKDDIELLCEHISHLPKPESVDEKVRRFDLLMTKMMVEHLLKRGKEQRYVDNMIQIADRLSTKSTIQQVKDRMPLITRMKEPVFYKDISQKMLRQVQEDIRDLMVYLQSDATPPLYSDIQDIAEVGDRKEAYHLASSSELYKRRVERFIRENKNHIAISKLRNNQPITQQELQALEEILFDGNERGIKEDFNEAYGEQPLGTFVRSIVGLDIKAANDAFAQFIQTQQLSADQIQFVNTIIQYLEKNGTIDKAILVQSPFDNQHHEGIFGIFSDDMIGKVISIIDGINENAGVG